MPDTPVECPLVVDLDGTLLRSDLLVESTLAWVRHHPDQAFHPLAWLARGKAHLKAQLASGVDIDAAWLPYNEAVLDLIRNARADGREVVLATASHQKYADQIAAHLNLFDRVLATDGQTNLASGHKRDALVALFGERGFDYAGNSRADLAIFAAARKAYVVDPEWRVETRAQAIGNVDTVIRQAGSRLSAWKRALRLHQWTKNLLIFVPLVASHRLADTSLLVSGLIAFLLFGLCASSVYLLNDLLDLEDDRHHPTKRRRPFASGDLSVVKGLVAAPVLLAAAFGGALLFLPITFTAVMAVYYLLTLTYSLSLKRMMMIDVVTLGMLYTLRIIAGTFAFDVSPTFWMLTFSMFIFQSLAMVKRYAELREARRRGDVGKTRGRGYYTDDLDMIAALGGASGYLSVLVLALYVQDARIAALYTHPQVMWLSCPLLLFWVSRIWMLTHRGRMHDDPVVFATKDPTSLIIGALFAVTFWLAR